MNALSNVCSIRFRYSGGVLLFTHQVQIKTHLALTIYKLIYSPVPLHIEHFLATWVISFFFFFLLKLAFYLSNGFFFSWKLECTFQFGWTWCFDRLLSYELNEVECPWCILKLQL